MSIRLDNFRLHEPVIFIYLFISESVSADLISILTLPNRFLDLYSFVLLQIKNSRLMSSQKCKSFHVHFCHFILQGYLSVNRISRRQDLKILLANSQDKVWLLKDVEELKLLRIP